jgi:hypothetical protein
MPLQPIIPTWLALNACDDTSPSGLTSLPTGDPIFAGGLNVGDYFDLTEKEAQSLSFTDTGILHSGRYRRIQVDPNANAGLVRVGTLGYMVTALVPDVNIVTSMGMTNVGGRFAIFLNSITPGNYGFIQELGVATAAIGGGTATAGSPLYLNGPYLGTTATGAPLAFALQAITGAGQFLVMLNFPVVQG